MVVGDRSAELCLFAARTIDENENPDVLMGTMLKSTNARALVIMVLQLKADSSADLLVQVWFRCGCSEGRVVSAEPPKVREVIGGVERGSAGQGDGWGSEVSLALY